MPDISLERLDELQRAEKELAALRDELCDGCYEKSVRLDESAANLSIQPYNPPKRGNSSLPAKHPVRPADVTREGQRKCGEWLAFCVREGWNKDELDELENLWWKYHDVHGNITQSAANHAGRGTE